MDLVKLDIVKIEIPKDWDYDKSVDKVNKIQYKYKNLGTELINELLVARDKLSVPAQEAVNISRDKSPTIKTWSDYCNDIGSSRRVVNRWLKQWLEPPTEIKQLTQPKLPEGTFNVIYADPPWQYDFSETQSREIEKNYPTLQPQEIIDLADKNGRLVKNVFHKDAVLFLWATAPKLKQCLDVLEEWGFEYKTNAIWDKKIIGMGYWFRGQHELLLVGTKGKFSPPIEESRESSVYTEKRTAHSKKPDYYYELIEKYFPNGKGLELFNRGGAYSNYWTVWGNEIE